MTQPGIVVAGAGQAAFAMATELRRLGWSGAVTLVGEEPHLPYQRPPLSKDFLTEYAEPSVPYFKHAEHYTRHGIEVITADPVTTILPGPQRLHLASGGTVDYEHLVLATGARNRELELDGADLDGVLGLHDLDQARQVSQRLTEARRAVVVGGGFIGLEFAAAATLRGVDVTILEASSRVMSRSATEAASAHLSRVHGEAGADLRCEARLQAIRGDGEGRVREVASCDGAVLPADMVLMAVGVCPNEEVAAAAGMATDDGIVVDEFLRTGDPRIWAIGDCARFPTRYATRPTRLESVQNAADQGRHVAALLCGAPPAPYDKVPWFWSDQGRTRMRIAGLSTDRDHVVLRGSPDEGEFSIFSFRGSDLVAVESFNRASDHMTARKLLANRIPLRPDQAADLGFDLKAHTRTATPA